MGSSRVFFQLTAAMWGFAMAYGCAVGADEVGDADCVVGSEQCECTEGGACDPGLVCLSGFCVDAGAMGGNPASTTAASGGMSSGGAPTGPATTTGATSTTGATTTGGATTTTGAATTSTTTGGGCALAEPTNVVWCASQCGACDPWPVSWDAVPGATHYRIRWSCSIAGETISGDIMGTSTDFANGPEVDAGNLGCGFGVHSVFVMACDATCCTSGAPVPTQSLPPACGGGCCA